MKKQHSIAACRRQLRKLDKEIFQLKGSKRFNGLKYVNFIHRWKNIRKGEPYDQFLGL